MRKKSISPRKEPVQERSIALRLSIIEAATYILKEEGPLGFTTNKVAAKAGVNIASLYQYYPNKESLLFHLVELDWQKTFAATYPTLMDEALTHRERLHVFVQKFFEIEAKDRVLKDAISHAGFIVEATKEYRELWGKGLDIFQKFLSGSSKTTSPKKLESDSEFIQHLITSFSENKLSKPWTNLKGDAKVLADMICTQFGIDD